MKRMVMLLSFSLLSLSCVSKVSNRVVMRVLLDGNPTTGYGWVFKGSDNNRVKLVASEHAVRSGSEGLVGAPGTFVFSFEGIEKGDDRLHFEYSRSWEKAEPARKHTVNVWIDDDLRVLER
ncbi:MAG TPA: hypothetical protein DCO86_02060 [Spirochaetaceae bacterium]|nr:hypothetical protein [Spirochaetaceae bacterium]